MEQIFAAISTSAISSAILVFLLRGWISERLKSAIAHEYNIKLADHKSQHDRDMESLRSEYSREMEQHKIRLKKSELVFERQFEAAKAIIDLKRKAALPVWDGYSDWGDLQESMALDLDDYAQRLVQIRDAHAPVMTRELRIMFDDLIPIIQRGAADADINDHDGIVVGQDARDAVDRLIRDVPAIEQLMLALIDSQIITEEQQA